MNIIGEHRIDFELILKSNQRLQFDVYKENTLIDHKFLTQKRCLTFFLSVRTVK